MRHQRAQLRAEQQDAVEYRPVERLDARAGRARGAASGSRRSNSAKANMPTKRCDRLLRPPLDAGREHHLGVGAAAEAVSALGQFRAQLPKVVDLAVVGDDVAAAGRMHRLRAGRREVDDRQPAVAEPDAGLRIAPASAAVRSAVSKGVRHGQCGGGGISSNPPAVERHQSRDAAHGNRSNSLKKRKLYESHRCGSLRSWREH